MWFPEAAADIILTGAPAQGSLGWSCGLCPETTSAPKTAGHTAERSWLAFGRFGYGLDQGVSAHHLFTAVICSGAWRLGRDRGNRSAPEMMTRRSDCTAPGLPLGPAETEHTRCD